MRVFFAYLLMTIGGLFAILTGGCGIVFLFGSLDVPEYIPISLILGGIPCATGAGIFLLGNSIRKRAKTLDKRKKSSKNS